MYGIKHITANANASTNYYATVAVIALNGQIRASPATTANYATSNAATTIVAYDAATANSDETARDAAIAVAYFAAIIPDDSSAYIYASTLTNESPNASNASTWCLPSNLTTSPIWTSIPN